MSLMVSLCVCVFFVLVHFRIMLLFVSLFLSLSVSLYLSLSLSVSLNRIFICFVIPVLVFFLCAFKEFAFFSFGNSHPSFIAGVFRGISMSGFNRFRILVRKCFLVRPLAVAD